MDIGSFFISLAALVPGIVLVTDVIIRIFRMEKKLVKQITAGTVSLLACIVGMVLNLGIFADFNIWYTLAYAFAAALGAMGLYTIEKIQMVLDFILQLLPKKV